uniref:Calmodulin-binding protein n=1 Tax=Leersia perrieri TaxID=77586 RepID=A0A0D9Y087_9ORYZ
MDPKRPRLTLPTGGAAEEPPAKRPRRPPASAAAEGIPSPRRSLLRQGVLVVVFLIRACRKDAADDDGGVSQIGLVVRNELCRYLGPILSGFSTRFSKLESKVESRLESMGQRIEDLNYKVDQITPLRPSQCNCNHQKPMHEAEKERTSAEGLVTNEGEAQSKSLRLRFLNKMKLPVYHDDEIKAENNKAIRIGIFNGEQMIKSGPLSNVKLEILALEGNFSGGSMGSWTSEEFNEHRACTRDGRDNVLAGECTVHLINGEACLGAIKFREGSCRARKGKFILAARVCDGERIGVQVQEAVMVPVVVQDRRNKSNEKSHPPKLDDKVHRLEEIAINGKYCSRLADNGIETVENFLKALNKDPDNLANILRIKKESKAWEKMVTHARECSLVGKNELKSYYDMQTNMVLIFNCVHSLVGAFFDGNYIPSDRLNSAQKIRVNKLKGEAYQLLDVLPFSYIMEGGFPMRSPMNTNDGDHHAAYHDHVLYNDLILGSVCQFKALKQLKAWTMLRLSHHLRTQTMNITIKVYPEAEVNYTNQTICGAAFDYQFQEAPNGTSEAALGSINFYSNQYHISTTAAACIQWCSRIIKSSEHAEPGASCSNIAQQLALRAINFYSRQSSTATAMAASKSIPGKQLLTRQKSSRIKNVNIEVNTNGFT